MKTLFRSLFLSFGLLALILPALAQNQAATGPTNALPATVVQFLTNGAPFYVANVTVTLPPFTFISGPITNPPTFYTNVQFGVTNVYYANTNALAYNIQYSVDANNSNWLTAWTWNPSQYPPGSTTGSNGVSVIDTPFQQTINFSFPMRVQAVTTNPITGQAIKTK